MLTAILTILIFLAVILVHEFGHFIVAKMNDIKVNEFSIGMGPKIFSRKKGETKYSIRALPIGGYVSMEGEDDSSDDPRGFSNKGVLARISVIVAGALMNFILAFLVFFVFIFAKGHPSTNISKVIKDSPAQIAGVKSGDTITKINNHTIDEWSDIKNSVEKNKSEKLNISLERENKSINKKIDLKGKDIMGIEPATKSSFTKSIRDSGKLLVEMVKAMFDFFGRLFTGKVSSNEVSGPVGVVSMVNKVSKTGAMNLVLITGFISVNLGFFNLLPIPALDGSRLMFLIIEAIRGKKLDPEKEGRVHLIGMALLIGFSIFITYKDIVRLITK